MGAMSAPDSLREDVRATVDARRELGPEFDGAVADSLLRRVFAEIDRRVDERVAATAPRPLDFLSVVLVLGCIALALGVPGATAQLGTAGSLAVTILAWVGRSPRSASPPSGAAGGSSPSAPAVHAAG